MQVATPPKFISRQFRFSGDLLRPRKLFILVLIAIGLLAVPVAYIQIQRGRAHFYCHRINAELAADPRFARVEAWKTFKPRYYLLSFRGSVRSEQDLIALWNLVAKSEVPGRYSVGVWIDPNPKP